jgi:hypothetical protein
LYLGDHLFGWVKAKAAQNQFEIRETLFGDMPWSQWLAISTSTEVVGVEPWVSFGRAKQLLELRDSHAATEILRQILETPGLESRHYLQAWHFLRDLGVTPPSEKQKELLGIIVEVGMQQGVDLVAAYLDHHARYYNYSGAGVVWERPNDSLDAAINDLLRAGAATIQVIGPWKGTRPPAPSKGYARINLLSTSGLHFGEGLLDALTKDQLGGPLIASSLRLMQKLVVLSRK